MKVKHKKDFEKYFNELENIIKNPDYVGINKKDNSVEYVKEILISGDFVKVAVRVSNSNNYYARSLYSLNNNRVTRFINNKSLIKVD